MISGHGLGNDTALQRNGIFFDYGSRWRIPTGQNGRQLLTWPLLRLQLVSSSNLKIRNNNFPFCEKETERLVVF